MMDFLSLLAFAIGQILVAFVEGMEALVYGTLIHVAVTSLAAWLLDRTRATRFARFLVKMFGEFAVKILCLVFSAIALAIALVLSALFTALSKGDGRQPSSLVDNGNNTYTCQCPAPRSYSMPQSLTCSGQITHAAVSTVHDLNAIEQLDENLSFIARGQLAELHTDYTRQAKAFVYELDSIRNQYSRIQSTSIPRYIAAEKRKLSGEGDKDCVEVEWAAVRAGFDALEGAGSKCEDLWYILYNPAGIANRLFGRISSSKQALEELSFRRTVDLVSGMSFKDRQQCHALLSGSLGLIASLQEAHGPEQYCKRHERRLMEASWRESAEEDVAGTVVRKDIGTAELGTLVEKRLDWPMLYTSPDSVEYD